MRDPDRLPDRWRPEPGAFAMRHMRVWTYLLAIEHTGSIRQAAERLNIAPSALQRRLRDVEQDLGFDLFERSAAGVRPSAAGEIFLGWVHRLPREITAFQARYPLISFECPLVGHDAAAERLMDGTADLVLAFGLAPRPEVLPLLSIGQRLCAVMARDHPLAGRAPLRRRWRWTRAGAPFTGPKWTFS